MQIICSLGMRGGLTNYKGAQGNLEGDVCVHSLDVVMGSQMHAYVKADQISYFKYVQFIIYQLHINKAVKNCFAKNPLPSLLPF